MVLEMAEAVKIAPFNRSAIIVINRHLAVVDEKKRSASQFVNCKTCVCVCVRNGGVSNVDGGFCGWRVRVV